MPVGLAKNPLRIVICPPVTDEEPGAQRDRKSAQGYTTKEQQIQTQAIQLQSLCFYPLQFIAPLTRANIYVYVSTYYLPDTFFVNSFNLHNKPGR